MNVIVTDEGFSPDDWTDGFVTLDDAANDVVALDVASDTDPNELIDRLGSAKMVRVDFPSSADGRGFTIARVLRLKGYTGRLRAKGNVLADQYAMARRCGFDEVEIDHALADRQPEDQWLARSKWQDNNYQARLRG
ncbi:MULTISPECIES: DUF934 domain-containing protein [unclassified Ruegeria]|uniref:DUF934 domain-containing protein n=1 Tax=unclassified Ruegeria TaxID=2625375 RepID=UPI001489C113|nr:MULTISPECIES: DUF934 domain-containing protein [unclassified Ruegeria]NOD75254.1 DUF934 domain-containing protein [Ruegeria sp. HKCCD4332]NOD87215.1 DUF934 domain-containing protein [Ruegeria sp. HKCCD4318]NOE12770.1 DUF934 domain-containing protein [Ruegeria sp. HKCCD4318-2]NOG09064.1 DUF934 domain-containing protein [Ruegeria sp. HKCCD4315]